MPLEPIPGQPQHATEEETMSVIRSVLTAQDGPTPSRRETRAQQATARAAMSGKNGEKSPGAFVEHTREPNPRRRRADVLPELQEAVEPQVPAKRSMRASRSVSLVARAVSFVVDRLRAFRPTPRHLALVSLALLVALRPHWFVVTGVLGVALIVGAFMFLGSDRIWRMVLAHLARVDGRNPARAALLRTRLDRFACRWDAILDFFPDGMVDGLYMPDLQAMQDGEEAHTAAMAARLERMVHES